MTQKEYNYPLKDKNSPCSIIQLVWHTYYVTILEKKQ